MHLIQAFYDIVYCYGDRVDTCKVSADHWSE